jgi:hypothetical protein
VFTLLYLSPEPVAPIGPVAPVAPPKVVFESDSPI